ncbi:hypothetical protein [Enterovibrio nigricans]|uniref:Alpha/beta hydrolase family protein n=1 Tax=Enterovibrio nigricans DSM 22720 TaxID=1121868 RepID=A0A1T4U3Z7_9GAMM|nr:hypothetical protein [Enterovibrio nigricans]PKF51854.1 hypothetical protein AT251_01340 [Enterovibrio nigricans]SKA47397.1 Alpha/beta hydrolase family protein [Enterovibrio nigricans DSM 22720]
MKVIKIIGGVFVSLLLVLGALIFLMPAPEKPVPTGEHSIGISEFDVRNGKVWVSVTAWYPAKASEGESFPYMATYLAEALSQQQGLPAALLEDNRPSHAIMDADAMEGKYPVLLFNHGFGSFATQNLTQMEELASQGYIVLSLSHPTHSLVTKSQDDDLVYQSNPLNQEDIAQSIEIGDRTSEAMRASQSVEQWIAAAASLETGLFKSMPAIIQQWVSNNELVLNALSSLAVTHPDLPFSAQLDLARIGVFGHSFGGSVAAHLAFNNPQIKAALSMDSYIYPSSVQAAGTDIKSRAPICVFTAIPALRQRKRAWPG